MSSLPVIGLIGGLSWESSAVYYRLINEEARRRLGPSHSARCLMWSFDFAQIEALQHAGRWDEAEAEMVDAARRLHAGGAAVLLICSNTMHRMAGAIEAATPLALLHIADPTGEAVRAAGFARVGLLGTAYTMEGAFYRERLETRFGLEVLVPDDAGRAEVHRVIYEELISGVIREESRAAYRAVIAGLVARGAQAVILGCTEIMLLVGDGDSAVPLFDTTGLHARAAVDWAMGREG